MGTFCECLHLLSEERRIDLQANLGKQGAVVQRTAPATLHYHIAIPCAPS